MNWHKNINNFIKKMNINAYVLGTGKHNNIYKNSIIPYNPGLASAVKTCRFFVLRTIKSPVKGYNSHWSIYARHVQLCINYGLFGFAVTIIRFVIPN